ncbi:MAG: hypothetical protein J7518_08815 [Nocardioidaceae bacterium]|nr:hypothetical protein [Nocardioidaceae bacterium]
MAALLAASVGSGALRPTATTISAGLTLSVDQTTVGVTVGANAVFAVSVSQPGSWVGPVSLAVTGAPVGAHVGITPNPLRLPGIPAIVTVFTGASTPVGSYLLTITATSGTYTQSITVQLVVSLPTGFTMTMSPTSATVVDGESTTYDIDIDRGLLSGPIALKVSGVPANATAKVSPSLSLLGSHASLKISTATNVVPGVYPITVKGSALLASGSATVYLIVVPQTYPDFPIAGSADRVLAPGSEAGAVNLAITNPFGATMTVTGLGVTVTGTDKPGCAASNYAVTAYGGPATLTIPPNSTRTLQQLGVPRAQWPQVAMLNLPVNQDACKGATVQLHHSGTGNGA